MPLVRKFFHVLLDDPDAPGSDQEIRVEVRGSDQLRAELEGKRQGVEIKDAMHSTYLWAWAAATREGKVDPKMTFRDFMVRCVTVEADDQEEPVDPTRRAVGDDSPSPSPAPTPAPPSTGG